jgi:predicted membrane protein
MDMKNKPQLNAPGQILLGVAVILLGFMFLLDNLGFINFRFTFHFWPTILIVAGVLKIAQSNTTSGYAVGGAMLLFGLLLTLKRLGLLFLSWNTVWPLLIIVLGLSVVYKSLEGRRAAGGAQVAPDKLAEADVQADGGGDSDSVIGVTAILGGYNRRITTPAFRGGEITAIMGGCSLDLRQCSIQGDAVLTVFALCGGITIKVPPDWSVVLQGTPILGGFEEKTAAPPDRSKRLLVKGYAIMGGLEVRN